MSLNTVEEFAKRELELLSSREGAIVAIAAAELAAGNVILNAADNESIRTATDSIGRARGALSGIDAALAACRSGRLRAISVKRADEAKKVRAGVAKLRAEKEKIEVEVSRHLTAVATLQRTGFAGAAAAKCASAIGV